MENWPFFDQNNGLTPLEKCQFFGFLDFLCYSVERRFFVLEYRKRHFPALNSLKRKVAKMAIYGPKPRINPFPKMSIFLTFLTFCFYSVERRFFSLQYR